MVFKGARHETPLFERGHTGETEKQDSGMNVTLTEYQVAEVLVRGHE